MKHAALSTIAALPFGRLLVLWRPLVALAVERSAGPFFASGRPNRYNLHGTATLYFGEDLLTAYAETVQEAAGLLLSHPTRETPVPSLPGGWDLASEEPVVVPNVKAQIKRVLDLTDANIQGELGVAEAALAGPWRWAQPGLTQEVGEAVYQSTRFEAIRYPSSKADDQARRAARACWCAFPDRLTGGSFLEVNFPWSTGPVKVRIP